jgi:hypothetical protein
MKSIALALVLALLSLTLARVHRRRVGSSMKNGGDMKENFPVSPDNQSQGQKGVGQSQDQSQKGVGQSQDQSQKGVGQSQDQNLKGIGQSQDQSQKGGKGVGSIDRNIMLQLEGFQNEDQSQKGGKFPDQQSQVIPDQQGQVFPTQPQGLPVAPGMGLVGYGGGYSPRGVVTYGRVWAPPMYTPPYDPYYGRRMRGLYY